MIKMIRFLKKEWYIILILLVSVFPVFLYLGNLPFSSWDESLFAMRAYHILERGELLFNFLEFDSYKDHSNRKPFLTSLIQVGFWKLFGISELNLRIPVSLAFLTLLCIPVFLRERLRLERIHVWCYALLLLTSGSMIRNHVVRTGDQDVFVCLYMFLAALFFYLYLNQPAVDKKKYLNLVVLFTFCTLYTKTIFAFMFFPGFLLYAIYKKRLKDLLSDRRVYLLGGILLFSFIGYNLYMNSRNPFFIEGFLNHALGRYGTVVDGQEYKGFSYYWIGIYQKSFSYLIYFLALSPILFIAKKGYKHRDLQIYSWIIALSFIFIISLSKTKTFWYVIPALPFVALLIALNIEFLFSALYRMFSLKRKGLVYMLLISCLFIPSYMDVMAKVIEHKYMPYYDFEMEGAMIRRLEGSLPEVKDYTILIKRENPQTSLYTSWFNEQKKYKLEIDIHPIENYKTGQNVLSCNYNLSETIRKKYNYKALSDWKSCHLMQIGSIR